MIFSLMNHLMEVDICLESRWKNKRGAGFTRRNAGGAFQILS